MAHEFMLEPGQWLGEGTIKFTESPDWLKYHCRWTVRPSEDGVITAVQEVEVEGVPEKMENTFTFADISTEKFAVHLSNTLLGEIDGSGVVDERVVAWEFRGTDEYGFEGFEIYERNPDGGYNVRAEFASADQLRTIVQGSIWKRSSSDQKEQ